MYNQLPFKTLAFCSLNVCLMASTEFNFPSWVPGVTDKVSVQHGIKCKEVIVPGTECHLYFPVDGSQPITEYAGEWSGARDIEEVVLDNVALWWVGAFGGKDAVEVVLDTYKIPVEGQIAGYGEGKIMKVDGFNAFTEKQHLEKLETVIWSCFYNIAVNPVGRSLLYRLLIEIGRVNGAGNKCCEKGVPLRFIGEARNELCRGIKIGVSYDEEGNSKYAFSVKKSAITYSLKLPQLTEIISRGGEEITLREIAVPSDALCLFHEMLHWFHCLRNPDRFVMSRLSEGVSYKYLARSYYGCPTDMVFWGKIAIDDEELLTILGAPDYNDEEQFALIRPEAFLSKKTNVFWCYGKLIKVRGVFIPEGSKYLNGDDLSENAFRCSSGLPMRWGHENGEMERQNKGQSRFMLAKIVSESCCKKIMGCADVQWDICGGTMINGKKISWK